MGKKVSETDATAKITLELAALVRATDGADDASKSSAPVAAAGGLASANEKGECSVSRAAALWEALKPHLHASHYQYFSSIYPLSGRHGDFGILLECTC